MSYQIETRTVWIDSGRVLTERVRAGPIQIISPLPLPLIPFLLKLITSVADGWVGHSETLLERKGCNEELRGSGWKLGDKLKRR